MDDSELWPDLGITGNTHSIFRKALTRSQTRLRKVKTSKIDCSMGLMLVRTLQMLRSGFIESFGFEDVGNAPKIKYLIRGSMDTERGRGGRSLHEASYEKLASILHFSV